VFVLVERSFRAVAALRSPRGLGVIHQTGSPWREWLGDPDGRENGQYENLRFSSFLPLQEWGVNSAAVALARTAAVAAA